MNSCAAGRRARRVLLKIGAVSLLHIKLGQRRGVPVTHHRQNLAADLRDQLLHRSAGLSRGATPAYGPHFIQPVRLRVRLGWLMDWRGRQPPLQPVQQFPLLLRRQIGNGRFNLGKSAHCHTIILFGSPGNRRMPATCFGSTTAAFPRTHGKRTLPA